MSPQNDIFSQVVELFSAEQEEVRAAAAFAAGMSKPFRKKVISRSDGMNKEISRSAIFISSFLSSSNWLRVTLKGACSLFMLPRRQVLSV